MPIARWLGPADVSRKDRVFNSRTHVPRLDDLRALLFARDGDLLKPETG